jgi:hypothetical protein
VHYSGCIALVLMENSAQMMPRMCASKENYFG